MRVTSIVMTNRLRTMKEIPDNVIKMLMVSFNLEITAIFNNAK